MTVPTEDGGLSSRGSTLSRREKALVKRNVGRPLYNGNELTNGQDISPAARKIKLPKKKPKGYTFWALVFALFVVALGNLFLTITIYNVLRLTKSMESIEVVTPSNLMKFYGEISINRIVKGDGRISGFADRPIEISSIDSNIEMKVDSDDNTFPSSVNVGLDSVEFRNIERFDMLHPGRRTVAFSTMFPNFGLPKGVQKLTINKASASRITSGLESSLTLQSDSHLRIRGNEKIAIDGKELLFLADQDLVFRSINGSITLDGKEGITIDTDNIPVAKEFTGKITAEYKLCICMPKGTLYRVPVLENDNSIHCGSVDTTGEDSPCY
nr:EOG090X0F7H [Eulimnadia texana]